MVNEHKRRVASPLSPHMLLFVAVAVGALWTQQAIASFRLEYVAEMLVVGGLVGVSVSMLRGRLIQNIAALIVLAVFFFCYCVKLMLIVMHPESPLALGMLPRLGLHNPQIADLCIGALRLTLCGVLAFCGTLALAHRLSSGNEIPKADSERIDLSRSIWLGSLAMLAVLSVVTAWLAHHFGIGAMGAEIKVALPYHLRGVVFYFRSYVLVGALLMLAYLAWRQGRCVWLSLVLVLFFLNALADALIRSSKAALLAPILYLFFLLVAAEVPIRRRHVAWTVFAVAPVLLSIPYLNQFRVFRNAGLDIWPALLETLTVTGLTPFEAIVHGAVWILYRLPGAEMLIGMLGHPTPLIGSRWLEVLASANGVAGFLTNEVFLVPPDHPHLAAPGYLGWWYLLLGPIGVFAGGVILGLVVKFGWAFVLSLRCRSAVLVRVFFMTLLFSAVSEGVLDALVKPLVAMSFTILSLELAIRLTLFLSRWNTPFAKQ